MNLMEMWLQHHPPVSSRSISKARMTTFSPSFLTQFSARMQQEATKINPSPLQPVPQPPNHALKAVALGFFMTANETWEDLFQTKPQENLNPFSAGVFFKQISTSL